MARMLGTGWTLKKAKQEDLGQPGFERLGLGHHTGRAEGSVKCEDKHFLMDGLGRGRKERLNSRPGLG